MKKTMNDYPPEYDQEILDNQYFAGPVWEDCPDCNGHGKAI